MNAQWAVVAAMAFINVAAVAAIWGGMGRAVTEHERRLDGLDKEQHEQWESIGDATAKIANIRGQLGMNGG